MLEPGNVDLKMPPKQDTNKIMADKVQRVREVVRYGIWKFLFLIFEEKAIFTHLIFSRGNVKTDDIILALHSFDLNVEKTIQAFCEGKVI